MTRNWFSVKAADKKNKQKNPVIKPSNKLADARDNIQTGSSTKLLTQDCSRYIAFDSQNKNKLNLADKSFIFKIVSIILLINDLTLHVSKPQIYFFCCQEIFRKRNWSIKNTFLKMTKAWLRFTNWWVKIVYLVYIIFEKLVNTFTPLS